jgi:hypothetical protein
MKTPAELPALTVPSKRTLAITTAIALAAAVAILVTIVLPAEYGIDPLGTGKRLGLNVLAAPPPQAVPAPAGATMYKPLQEGPVGYYAAPAHTDSAQFTLRPYEYVEYKYRLEEGATMVYSWTANDAVVQDFHGERDGAPAGQAESYDKRDRKESYGAFTAPFPGIHGWYWENPGGNTITIDVISMGFYSAALEIRMDHSRRAHELKSLNPAN